VIYIPLDPRKWSYIALASAGAEKEDGEHNPIPTCLQVTNW